ncbi:MAG: thermonuclease family protein [Candidatus Omnitrophica bacterium]|nr:thermonuclease family protein [Candidatus Omnitrophota bacterium]
MTKFLSSLLLIVLSLTGCQSEGIEPVDGYYKVAEIVDGDTVLLTNGKKVRYIGIDTPETRKKIGTEWIHDPEPFANEAKKYNESLVAGSRVRLEFDKEKYDKYNRWLAYVYTDNGIFANRELVSEGLAKVYMFPPNTRYYKLLYDAQEEAKKSQKGIWT